ncbi:MAG: sensor histidine kinase [Eisenbergiella sp.]
MGWPGSLKGKILVFIRKSEDMLRIVVKDTGIGMSVMISFSCCGRNWSKAGEFSKEVSGTGLKNINDRIRIYYGERYGMVIDSKEGKGTTVALLLPADG